MCVAAKFRANFKASLIDINADDLPRPKRSRNCAAKQSDGTGTEDDYCGGRLDLGLFNDMDADTKRFDECSRFQTDVIRQLVAEVFGKSILLRQRTVHRRRCSELHLKA